MNEIMEHEGSTGVAQSVSMVQALTRAEIDQQIATAHQFPRSLTRVSRNILSLVTISEKAAGKCMYALPRGGKPITGPSIRLAEIVASQWGNCRIGARVVHVDRAEKFVEAEGIFHDLETNTATTSRVRRRISDKNGRLLSDDMIIVTGNAAAAIAKRNAIFGGVPEAVWGEAYEQAEFTVKGDIKTLPERRGAAMKAMAAFGIKAEQVYALLGVAGERDIGLDQLVVLGGAHAALKSGETTTEELLGTIEDRGPRREPGGITNRTAPAAPKSEAKPARTENPDAEKAIEDEARRVAEKKTAAASGGRLLRLAAEYEAVAGKKADGRWSIDRLADEIAALKDAATEDAEPDANDDGSVDETNHDPDTGEVLDDDVLGDDEPASAKGAPDPEQWANLYNTMINDLLEGDPSDVRELYGPQIEQMAEFAPELHEQLMSEFAAAEG